MNKQRSEDRVAVPASLFDSRSFKRCPTSVSLTKLREEAILKTLKMITNRQIFRQSSLTEETRRRNQKRRNEE